MQKSGNEIMAMLNESLNKRYTNAEEPQFLETALELAKEEKLNGNLNRYTELKSHVIKVCKLEIGSGHPSPDMIYFNTDNIRIFKNILNKAIAL